VNKVLRYTIEAVDKSASVLKSVASRVASFARGVFTNLMNIQAGFQMLSGAVRKAASVMTIAFRMETLEKQFAILMKSTDAARERMADLQKFAAETPFDLEGIAVASRQLHVFSGGALGGVESLRLVGDAAAATGTKIEELSFWVGRAYSMIKGGQPFGEAAMRLQEMGVMTPKARAEMEKLQASGANAYEVWGVLAKRMGEFDGGMKDLSKTGDGLVATLKDNWTLSVAEFGKAFANLAKTEIGYLISQLDLLMSNGSIAKWAEDSRKAIEPVVTAIMNLTSSESRHDTLDAAWDYLKAVFGYGADILKAAGDYIGLKIQASLVRTFTGKAGKQQADALDKGASDMWSIGKDQARLNFTLETEEAKKKIEAAAAARIEAAKPKALTPDEQKLKDEQEATLKKESEAKIKADLDAGMSSKARDEYAEAVKAEAETLREQERAHLQAASEYAAAAEQLSQKGAERFAQWESVGFRDMDAWRAEEAGKKAGLDDEAKYEKALKKAADRERRLGERSLKKSDKEILDFEKKRQAELKRAADEAMKAEQLRQREREERKEADRVQREIRDLLKRNLQMDGGGNAGGPE
jgi:hypothetical protein